MEATGPRCDAMPPAAALAGSVIDAVAARLQPCSDAVTATVAQAIGANALERLRAAWHGECIAVHVAAHTIGEGSADTPETLAHLRAVQQHGR